MSRKLVALFFGGILFAALPVFAQADFTGLDALTISADPVSPGPDSVITLTAQSPLLDLRSSTIEWSANGKAIGTGTSVKFTTSGLGQETDIAVSVSGPSGSDSAQLTVIPTSIDLLWEAGSYVPPFYKGRAVAGSGSTVRVFAVPHFVEANGTVVPSSNIDFTWKLNGGTDEGQSGIGESSAVFPAATLYGTDAIELDAQTTDGSLSGEASVNVPTQNPQLVLYEDDPLFGVMYYDAIPQSSAANESETSFAAVPYFAAASSANSQSLAYTWTVNGSPVTADAQDPSEITIDSQSSGTAQIALSLGNSSDPFFSASGSWQIQFSGAVQSGTSVFQSQ